ncbi:MAG: ArsR/SmtB family transcription factor [Spirochaetota bacterium]
MADNVLIVDADDLERFARALASPVRRRMVDLLRDRELNVNRLAREAGVSQSAAVTHVQALERAGLVTCRTAAAAKGTQKLCTSNVDSAVLLFRSSGEIPGADRVVIEMPVGLFFDHEVHPACGLASADGLIGYEDSPASFLDPRRASAGIIWFEAGYVEYRMPIGPRPGTRIVSIAVSAEVCSEFPGHRPDWPSDITVWMNGCEIGTFRAPGDPGDRRGHLNPAWWPRGRTEYGYLKEWRVTRDGSFVDGVPAADVRVDDLRLDEHDYVSVRIGVGPDAPAQGGLNVLGRSFGNHRQDIRLTLAFEAPSED